MTGVEGVREQLRRILQLALSTPYEGEKEKAVALLVQRLGREGWQLSDLDPSFSGPDQENRLRERAGLPYLFEVTLRSREEASFYARLVQRVSREEGSVTWLEGHRLRCRASREIRERVEAGFAQHSPSLGQRLAHAQQQALQEYQERRRTLFEQAVEDEVAGVEDGP